MVIDWDDAFDNSAYVPGSDDFADRCAQSAARFRDTNPPRELVYGDRPRNRIDLFLPEHMPRGLFLFVHGGYWHLNDRHDWSHLAAGALARGWAVAVPGYTLAPQVRIADITAEIALAVTAAADAVAGPIRLVGHSAGGHLAARMACCDAALPDAVARRIERVVPVSGIHDLRPLVHTRMNQTLNLDAEEAAAESPALRAPRPGIAVTAWVGAQERPELVRQTRLLSESWSVANSFEPGQDHFSVIEAMARPDSPLLSAIFAEAL